MEKIAKKKEDSKKMKGKWKDMVEVARELGRLL